MENDIYVLMTEGAYEMQPSGYFESEEELHNWLKKAWDVDFNEYLKKYPNADAQDWYCDLEITVHKVKKLKE